MSTTTAQLTRAYEVKIDDVSKPRRTVTAKVNTGIVDRYRTVIPPSGANWRNYMSSGPAVLWEHGKDPVRGRMPVAHCSSLKYRKTDDDILSVMHFKSDPYSQLVFDNYADGTLVSFSIEFLPDETSSSRPTTEELRTRPDWKEADIVYRKWELTGVSAVSYPGNPQAVALAVERGLWVPDETWRTIREKASVEKDGEDDEDDETERYVKHEDGKWVVYSDNGNILGKHDSKADAVDQWKAYKVHQQQDKEKSAPRSMGEGTGSQGGYATKVKAKGDEKPEDEPEDAEPDDDEDDEQVKRYIKHEGGKWIVYSEAGKVLGKHDSKADAVAQLQAIEANKHKKSVPPWIGPEDVGRALADIYDRLRVIEEDSAEVRNMTGDEKGIPASFPDPSPVISTQEVEVESSHSVYPSGLPTFTMQDLNRTIVESLLPITQAILANQRSANEAFIRDLRDISRGRV